MLARSRASRRCSCRPLPVRSLSASACRERHAGVAVAPAELAEQLADVGRRSVAPAVARGSGRRRRTSRAPLAREPPLSNSVSASRASRRAAGRDEPGLATPSLVSSESAPPSVFRPNSGFDPGISVMRRDRDARNQVPADDVAEWLVHAHAVEIDRQALRRAEQRRRGEAAKVDVGLERVVLDLVDVDAAEARGS